MPYRPPRKNKIIHNRSWRRKMAWLTATALIAYGLAFRCMFSKLLHIYVQLIDVAGVDCDLEGVESKTCDLCLHLHDDSISASCVAI